MYVWYFINEKLVASENSMLLYVIDSEGSSPGRRGFKMAVAADGTFAGTIGGGIMEHKLVEKAKQMLTDGETKVELVRQFHDKQNTQNRSGMICSGSQVIVYVPLFADKGPVIEKIIRSGPVTIQLSPVGLTVHEIDPQEKKHSLLLTSEEVWLYRERINERPVIHIIGGGHVSLALSELMCFLGFYSKVYDDRKELNTIMQNFFANEKIIIPSYKELGEYVQASNDDFAVIMTIGYRTDKIALKQLLDKGLFYLGMLGSVQKIETLFSELREEGVSKELLDKVFTPVGIHINSKTPQEIAVSIAAEIITEKNK